MAQSTGRLTFALLVALTCVGCERIAASVPQTRTVPVLIWAVLGTGESLGDPWNVGCRLSYADIRDRVRYFQNHADLWGPNVELQWLPEHVELAECDILERPMTLLDFDFYVLRQYWFSDSLNIYFAGHVGDLNILAASADPRDAETWPSRRAFLRIHDGGKGEPVGFKWGYEPEVVRDANLTEHELAHFFARFNSRTLVRTYNPGEHDTLGPNTDNLLRPGGAGWPVVIPLKVWGEYNRPVGTERGEIFDRISRDRWRIP